MEDALIRRFAFTAEELEPAYEVSGEPILTHKMAWARTYLKFGSLLSNDSRGVWVLTESGRASVECGKAELQVLIRNGKKAKRSTREGVLPVQLTSATHEAADMEEGEEQVLNWSDRLLSKLQSIEPAAF